jgi:hypothetical protein
VRQRRVDRAPQRRLLRRRRGGVHIPPLHLQRRQQRRCELAERFLQRGRRHRQLVVELARLRLQPLLRRAAAVLQQRDHLARVRRLHLLEQRLQAGDLGARRAAGRRRRVHLRLAEAPLHLLRQLLAHGARRVLLRQGSELRPQLLRQVHHALL